MNSHTWYISQLLVQCALSFRPNILVYISGNFQGESPGKRSTSRVIPNCFKKISDRGLPFHLILLLGILSSMIQQSFWKLSNEISVPFTPVSKVQGFFRRMERAQCDRSVVQPLALSFKRLTNGWRSSSVQCKNLQKGKYVTRLLKLWNIWKAVAYTRAIQTTDFPELIKATKQSTKSEF